MGHPGLLGLLVQKEIKVIPGWLAHREILGSLDLLGLMVQTVPPARTRTQRAR